MSNTYQRKINNNSNRGIVLGKYLLILLQLFRPMVEPCLMITNNYT